MNTITITQPNNILVDIRVDAIIAVREHQWSDKSKMPVVYREGAMITTMADKFATRSTREQVCEAMGAETAMVPHGKPRKPKAK